MPFLVISKLVCLVPTVQPGHWDLASFGHLDKLVHIFLLDIGIVGKEPHCLLMILDIVLEMLIHFVKYMVQLHHLFCIFVGSISFADTFQESLE